MDDSFGPSFADPGVEGLPESLVSPSLEDDALLDWAQTQRLTSLDNAIGNQRGVEFARAVRDYGLSNALVIGPAGSGRTTLVRLMAHAALCETPPTILCNNCASCAALLADSHERVELVNCRFRNSHKEVAYLIDRLASAARTNVNLVLLENIDLLEGRAADALADFLASQPGCLKVFATAEHGDAIPQRLRIQFREGRAELPSLETRRQLVFRVAAAHGVHLADGVASSIAAIGKGYGDTIDRLEHVARASATVDVTRQAVADLLLDGLPDRLAGYLMALARGDLEWQLSELRAMRLSPENKAEAIRKCLLHLKHSYIGPNLLLRTTPPEVYLPGPDQCAEVVTAFDERSRIVGIPLVQFANQVLLYWSELPGTPTAAVLELQATRCQDMLEGLRMHAPALATWTDRPVRALMAEVTEAALEYQAVMKPAAKLPPRTQRAYLNKEQAFELYEAATYQLQEYGYPFNFCISVNHAALGQQDDYQCSSFAKSLSSKLAVAIRLEMSSADAVAYRRDPALNRIILHERCEGGIVSTIIGAMPPELFDYTEHWIRDVYLQRSTSLKNADPRAIRLDFADLGNGRKGVERHWMLMRRLWRGTDPALQERGTPLLDLLQVPAWDRQPAGVFTRRRYSVSKGISESAQAASAEARLVHLSPVQDRAWNWVFSGWELQEYLSRCEEKVRIGRLMAEISESCDGNRVMEASRIDDMRRELPVSAKKRSRNWSGWWNE